MSVIFKEKKYDQLAILVKTTAFILLTAVIILFFLNNYFSRKADKLSFQLQKIQAETLKYKTLLKSSKNDLKTAAVVPEKHLLLKKLAFYADNLAYDTVQLKNNNFYIRGSSPEQQNVFSLLERINQDSDFEQSSLKSIQQRDKYYFEVEAVLKSS